MDIIDNIKNKAGKIIYPKSLTKAIYEEGTNRRLDVILSDLEENQGGDMGKFEWKYNSTTDSLDLVVK